MRMVVVGSAAGGGYPQWNCRCAVCDLFWRGDPRVRRRTQSSLAASRDGRSWTLFNASPDIREQIAAVEELWPRSKRDTPITDVVLTNGDVDHIGGLISLREGSPFTVHATREVLDVIDGNSVFAVLSPEKVKRERMVAGRPFQTASGLVIEPFEVPGKIPLYLEESKGLTFGRSGNTVGVELRDGDGGRAFYLPGCAEIDEELAGRIRGADLVFFDGTLWADDEMQTAGVGDKTGRRMGHMSVSGPDGSLTRLKALDVGRAIFVHINNTNPLLVDGSPERQEVERAGYAVGYDGMRIEL